MLALLQQPLVQQLGQTTLGTAVAYKVAKGGHKRGSLNYDGAIAAFTVAALAFKMPLSNFNYRLYEDELT